MKTIFPVTTFALALALTPALSAPANASDNAKTILRQAEMALSRARTFEATVHLIDLKKDAKKPVGVITIHSAGQKARLEMRSLPGAVQQFRMLFINDGRNFIVYVPDTNKYGVGQALPRNAFYGFLPTPSELAAGTYGLLPSEKLDGRPVYVIVSLPRLNSEEPRTYYYIDKATYHLLQMKSESKDLGSILFAFRSERFNVPVSPGIFKFSPPKGVEKVNMADSDAGTAASSSNPLGFMSLALGAAGSK